MAIGNDAATHAGTAAPVAVPFPAKALGAAGLLPFAVLTGVVLLVRADAVADLATRALVLYGAIILSFMGGCRWGFAAAGLGEGATMRLLTLSVAPSLYAWGAAMLEFRFSALLLSAGFALLYIADRALQQAGGAPVWWTHLRLPLTIGAGGALAIAGIAGWV